MSNVNVLCTVSGLRTVWLIISDGHYTLLWPQGSEAARVFVVIGAAILMITSTLL